MSEPKPLPMAKAHAVLRSLGSYRDLSEEDRRRWQIAAASTNNGPDRPIPDNAAGVLALKRTLAQHCGIGHPRVYHDYLRPDGRVAKRKADADRIKAHVWYPGLGTGRLPKGLMVEDIVCVMETVEGYIETLRTGHNQYGRPYVMATFKLSAWPD